MLDKVQKLVEKAQKPSKKRRKGSDSESSSDSGDESDTTDDEKESSGKKAHDSQSVVGRLSGAGRAGAMGHPDHTATPEALTSGSKVPKLSKALAGAATRMNPMFQLQKFVVEREGCTVLEATTVSDLFSAVQRQFRLEAKMDQKSQDTSDAVLDYLDFAATEAVSAFKAQVKPIVERADLVKSAETMFVMKLRNKIRNAKFIRKVDFMSLISKTMLKTVEPIV